MPITPSINLGDSNTGLYKPDTDQIGITISGDSKCIFAEDGLTVPVGSISAPSLSTINSGVGLCGDANSVTLIATSTISLKVEATKATLSSQPMALIRQNDEVFLKLTSYNNAADHAKVVGYAARGTSASPDYLSNSEAIIYNYFFGWQSGTTFRALGGLTFVASGQHSNGNARTRFNMLTTPNGSITLVTGALVNETKQFRADGTIQHNSSTLGFLNTAPTTQPTVSGKRDTPEEALKSLLDAAAALGLITDDTTAT